MPVLNSLVALGFALFLSLPLAAQTRPAQGSLPELKARIEGDNRNHPEASVRAAEAALALLGPSGDLHQRLGFLAGLSRDLNTLGNSQRALDIAREGQALLGPSTDPLLRVQFGMLAARALQGRERAQEAAAEFAKIAPLLPSLANAPEVEARTLAATAYRALGSIQLALSKLPDATEAMTKALRLSDQLGDLRGQANAYDALAGVYGQSGHLQEAEAATKRAIELGERLKDVGLLANFHLSLSGTYGSMGNADQQLAELRVAQALAQKSHDAAIALIVAVNLADVSLRRKDYPGTLKHAEEAIALAAKAEDQSSLAVSQINKGIALNRMGRPEEGLRLIQLGRDHFKRVGAGNYLVEVMGILAEEHAFNRDFERAYLAHVEFKKLNDDIIRLEDQKRMAEAGAAYNSEKKQREIEALQKEQRNQAAFRNLWILAGLLGLSTTVVLILSRRKLETANRALEDMTLKDPLTGLANRRYLATRIDEDLAQVRRLHGTPGEAHAEPHATNIDVVFMMVDIDHFKQVNDQHGHAAGDAVLKQFATILFRTMRDSDTVVRWGGEEFFVMAKNASRVDAHILAERLRRAVAKHPFDLGEGLRIHKTCSLGFAFYPFRTPHEAPVPWETVAEMADQCLYAAKHSGRDMWVGIHPDTLDDESSLAKLTGWVDVAECVRQGSIQAQASDGRTIRWPD